MSPTPLARAATVPSRCYLDPAILEREKELVIGRSWQLVARADELRRIGDFVPVTFLDEPIVITHGPGQMTRFSTNVTGVIAPARPVTRRCTSVACNRGSAGGYR